MELSRRHFTALAAGALFVPTTLQAQAQRGPSAVELFTSQGCSSCPPADLLMAELYQDPETIPITYSVEIWDYLGWRDTLARPAFTQRQRAYAAAVAGKRVYTPQAIINGRAHCVGSDRATISRLKGATAAATGNRVAIKETREGWMATLPAGSDGTRVVLVPVARRVTVQIGRGENSGRSITYANVARDIRDLGEAVDGRSIAITRSDINVGGADGFVMILQGGTIAQPGAIFACGSATADGIKA